MKCEIASDLLALYVDDLCSTETRNEVELHLKDCPECEKKLENYRKNLNSVIDSESAEGQEKVLTETEAEIEPMKKVKKKMKKSKRKVIALSIVLLLVFGCISVLSYGEATNLYPGFTVISDALKIKSACKDLTKGKTEPFVNLLATHLEDQYILRATGAFEDMDAYMQNVQADVEEAYEYYFKGKNVTVKVDALYANPYNQTAGADEVEAMIGVSFYEGDEKLYRMDFGKVAHDRYVVDENFDSTPVFDEPTFTGGLIPYDDIILKIALPYAAQSGYRKLENGETQRMGGGLILLVEKTDASENEIFNEQMREKMDQLFERGCYIKHVTYNMCDFDTETGKWIYNVWITYEDQHTGTVFVTEQKFLYHKYKMYVIEGETPVITSISSSGEAVPTDAIEIALSLFQ